MADDDTHDSLYERVPGSEASQWVLLGASRLAITGLALGIVFVGIVAILYLDPAAFERAVERGDPVQTLFQALVTAIVTGVTLVVSINSLVLSQELGPAGEQREKMDESTAFREDVARMLDAPVSPAEPATFLRTMLEQTATQAATLRDAIAATTDEDARVAINAFADGVERDAGRAGDRLSGAEFGTFDVVAGSLGFDYSAKLYEVKRIVGEHEEVIDDDTGARLEDLRELLHHFGPAREHVKTLYFQWELVDLSRAILYAAVPALVVSVTSVLVLGDPRLIPGSTFGLANQAWIVAGATTVALAPFAILLAYILRVATVAKHTLAIGPFLLRRDGDRDRSQRGR